MSTSRLPNDPSQQARTIGSSLALSLAIVGFVLLILAAGALLIFRDDGDDNENAAAIPSPSGTSELVILGSSPTPEEADISAGDTATATIDVASETSTATSTTTPTSTPTEPDEVAPTATEEEELPTPTEEVVQSEPTEEPTVEPEPTDLPLEGEFGFLPPAQLPSGGVSSTLELEYQLGMSLESLPASGTVYLLSWPTYSLADVEFARDRLAFQGDVVEEGVGVYRVESARGTLFVSPTEIIFRAAGFSEGDELPDDATAIEIAREWISLSGFIGETDAGAVAGREEEAQRIIVKFRPPAPQPNLAPNPAATVTIGPGGTVLEVRIAWPSALTPSEYGYSDALDIWEAVQANQGFLEADITSVFATGQLTGVATIVDYSTAYTLAGNPSTEQYLVPVIRFEGSARIDQTGDEIPITVSIPVVYFEEGTAG